MRATSLVPSELTFTSIDNPIRERAMRLYGDFEENGYRFRAFIPEKAEDGVAFKVEMSHAGKPLHEFRVPMEWEPRFGPDAADVRRLEAITGAILKFLPAPAKFSAATIARIDATVAEMS